MIGIAMLLSFSTFMARANDFDDRLAEVNSLSARADVLLKKAGVRNSEIEQHTGKVLEPILNVYSDNRKLIIPEGALLQGRLRFRLLVGGEPSPVQIALESSQRFPWASGVIASGTATQGTGRVLIEVNRLLFPNGTNASVKAAILDEFGSLGLEGTKESSKLFSFLESAAVNLSAPRDQSYLGQAGMLGLSPADQIKNSILDQSRTYLSDQLKETSTLKVEENSLVTLIFKTEVKL